MGLIMMINVAVVIATTLLLTGLLAAYAGMLRQAPSRFTWGLSLFAAALWFQAAVQLYFFATMMPLYAGGVESIILVQNLLAMLASGVLLAVTLRPMGAARATPSDA